MGNGWKEDADIVAELCCWSVLSSAHTARCRQHIPVDTVDDVKDAHQSSSCL